MSKKGLFSFNNYNTTLHYTGLQTYSACILACIYVLCLQHWITL